MIFEFTVIAVNFFIKGAISKEEIKNDTIKAGNWFLIIKPGKIDHVRKKQLVLLIRIKSNKTCNFPLTIKYFSGAGDSVLFNSSEMRYKISKQTKIIM